ncbi:MAG: non-heme iron oxygenase ferredoxin subunit [Xanthomonadales bacterium]|nr:non-heme iron oxygenase ferredoxin subunit [Xanthomonadales bacterium]MCC6595355.1 non-heme iron oxygenase ferredoxin subunit [Rhodanobacteraceae bacterium]MDL1870144.1 non-heme iron oxygenase ferredoxin subunit [Gammaproteobacteria bacterium PRO6]
MMEWVRVCTTGELLPGEYQVAWDGDTPIAVINLDGELYAIEDVCTHDGGELTGGVIEGRQIECPRHGARFDIMTGAVLRPPATVPIATFPVRVEDGVVYTRDDRGD